MGQLARAIVFLVTVTVSFAASAMKISIGAPSEFFFSGPSTAPLEIDTGMGTVQAFPFVIVDQFAGTGTFDMDDGDNFSLHASGSNVTTLGLGTTPVFPDVTGSGAWSFDVSIDVVMGTPSGQITFFGVNSPSVPLDLFGASGKVAELGMVTFEPFGAFIDVPTGDIVFSGFADTTLTVNPTTDVALFGSGGLAITPIPLPATLPLLGVAAFVLLGTRRRLRA